MSPKKLHTFRKHYAERPTSSRRKPCPLVADPRLPPRHTEADQRFDVQRQESLPVMGHTIRGCGLSSTDEESYRECRGTDFVQKG